MNRIAARVATIVITCLATLAANTVAPPLAAADDPVIIDVPVVHITAPITYEPTFVAGGEIDGFSVTLPPADAGGPQVDSQCVDIPGVGRSCIGTPTQGDLPPLDVTGGESLAPLVKWNDEARAALDWMIPEGIEHVRTLYRLPADDRILTYARPQLRTFMVARLHEIMDKKVYGVPLTENEENALAWVEQQYIARDRLLAEKAYAEYVRFKEVNPCTYRAPAAPAWVEKPVTMPKKVTDWCKLPNTGTTVPFEFVPPLPTPTEFTTWAAYRNAKAMGLSAMDDPIALNNLTQMTTAAGALGGFGATSGAAFIVAGATALSNLATIGTKILPFASRGMLKPIGEAMVKIAPRLTKAGSGFLAVAVIAIAVIVFLVVTGVSIWLLIQHDSVSETLRSRVDATAKATDPFGLDPLAEELSGKPLNSELDLENPPAYRTYSSFQALSARVAEWTSTYDEGPPGVVGTSVADPEGLWEDNATTSSDVTWVVTTGNGDPVEREEITVPLRDGSAEVRFSRGWMVVTKTGEEPRAMLELGYVDSAGRGRVVTADPASKGLLDTFMNAQGDPQTVETSTLTYRNAQNEIVRARVRGVPPTYLAGPRPVSVGPLVVGRPVLLRPNPVGTDGSSLDEALVTTDYSFDWTVERLDAATGSWGEVSVPDGYGTKFVPTLPGEYDARVTMTSVDDPTAQQYGSVRFTVTPPAIAAPVAQLSDNGFDRLELDLQLLEEVPTDDLSITVTWPGDLGSDTNPTQTLASDCIQTGPIECTTPRTGLADALVFTVTPQTDLRRPIRVVATNSTGGSFEAEFLLGEGRPTIAAPPPGLNDSEPGTTLVAESSVQVSMPLPAVPQVQDYLAAQLVPSPGGGQDFALVDPATGNTTGALLLPTLNQGVVQVYEDPGSGAWYLEVRGIPDLSDVGTLEIPVVIEQVNDSQTINSRQLVMVTVHVHASNEDRFRAALQSDIDPQDFGVDVLPDMYPMVLGGRTEDPAYTGDMCVSLQTGPFTARVLCRPVEQFATAGGVAKPFPYAELYPGGMSSGNYRAEAWLTGVGPRIDNEPLGTSFFLTTDVAAPGKPTVTSSTPSAGAVTVAFSPPVDDGGGAITGYSAQCVSTDGGVTRGVSGVGSPIKMVNLTAEKSYRCRVRATNAMGTGAYGAYGATVVLPAATAPPGPSVTSSTPSAGAVSVAFSSPGGDGGSPITGYNAQCVSTDGGVTRGVSGVGTPITVVGLTVEKSYRCRVRGTNAVGTGSYGAYGATVVLPAASAPPGPSVTGSTPSAGAVSVAFSSPDGNGGSPTNEYYAQCVSTDGGVTRGVSGVGSPITVVGLTVEKSYRCRVRGTNAVGVGSYGAYGATVVLPAATAPPGPSVTSSTPSAGAVSVAFSSRNGDGGSPITGYYAQCVSTDGGVTRGVSGVGTPIKVVGLTVEKSYRCRVRATNAVGTGAYGAYGAVVVVSSRAEPSGGGDGGVLLAEPRPRAARL